MEGIKARPFAKGNVSPQACLHKHASTSMPPQACLHKHASTSMPPQARLHKHAPTSTPPQACLHKHASTNMPPFSPHRTRVPLPACPAFKTCLLNLPSQASCLNLARTMSGRSQTTADTDRFTEALDVLLQQVNRYKRAPGSWQESWEALQQAHESSTAKIFANQGFHAWFAYFLTKNGADIQFRFRGKAACNRVIARLDTEPPNFGDRTASENSRPAPSSANPISPTATPTSARAPPPSLDDSTPEQVLVHSSVSSSNHLAEDGLVFVNGSLEMTTRLFPREFSDGIMRNPHPRDESTLVAAMSMTFPNAPYTDTLGCQVALEITEDKVQHLARELFGVRLEIRAGLRYLCVPGGSAKVLPNPNFTLQGCRCDAILPTFGPEMSKAIQASPKFQEEAKQWRDCTDCVSMVISHMATERAIMYLSLGLWEGTQIKERLYV
ncbi:putative serine threonine protein kinase [Ilyonectria robusta]